MAVTQAATGWIQMPAAAASYRIVGSLNSSMILGAKLCESSLMQNFLRLYN